MRDLRIRRSIDAMETTIRELEFHADRLETQTEPEIESEAEHLSDLVRGYRESAHYVKILRNYQSARLRSERPEQPTHNAAHIDEEVAS